MADHKLRWLERCLQESRELRPALESVVTLTERGIERGADSGRMLMKFPDVLEPSLQPREGLVRRCAEGHCVTAFYPNCFYRFKLTVASYCQEVEITFQKSI